MKKEKKMLRKNIKSCITLAITMSAVCSGISGCGTTKEDAGEVKAAYTWPLGTSSPEDTVTQVFAEKFAEEVSRLSNGEMVIDIYPNSTIGNDSELLESCEEGDIPFVVQNTAPQVSYIPETAVFDYPCAFDSIEDARKAVDNEEFYGELEAAYNKYGYELLSIADQGFRVMTTNVKIEDINDFKGQKIRTMENANQLSFWKNLNSNPTPMAFSEVYIGLQQKTIDAEENPVEVIVSGKLYEQQDYIVETNHLPHYITLFVNEKLFDGLNEEEQKIMTEAADIAKNYAREQADERIEDRMKIIEESGTEVITPSEELYEQMRQLSQDTCEAIREQVGDELVDSYLKK